MIMVGMKRVFSSFAVDDIQKAKEFYEQTLGLTVEEDTVMGMLHLKLADGATVMVYPKPDHTPASFTVLNFVVENLDQAVDELIAKGVNFEKYEGFSQDEKGIARSTSPEQGPDIAWCKDPAGNIIAVFKD